MTHRANDRFSEIEKEFKDVVGLSKSELDAKARQSKQPAVPEQRRDFFGEILKQIDILNGVISEETMITLKRDQFHEDLFSSEAANQKVYRVALPTKPAIVSVQLVRSFDDGAEGTLCCYASTDCSNPSAQNYQLYGETSIEYMHYFPEPVEAEKGGYIDRRQVAPNKKFLFLSVEFSQQKKKGYAECRYRIRYELQKITIAMTGEEFRAKPRVVPMRQWEKSVQAARQDPEKQESLNGIIQQRHEEMRARIAKLDCVKRNKVFVSPMIKFTHHCQKAVKNCQQAIDVQKRKAALDERRVEWLQRAEARRVQRIAAGKGAAETGDRAAPTKGTAVESLDVKTTHDKYQDVVPAKLCFDSDLSEMLDGKACSTEEEENVS